MSPICHRDDINLSFGLGIFSTMRILETSGRGECILVLLSLLAAGSGWGADANNSAGDPLLDLFIQKGYVTQQEAVKVKAEADPGRGDHAGAILEKQRHQKSGVVW
jgi:hypothetical protein